MVLTKKKKIPLCLLIFFELLPRRGCVIFPNYSPIRLLAGEAFSGKIVQKLHTVKRNSPLKTNTPQKLIWKHLCFHSSKQHMTYETNLFHPCRSGQRLAAWSVSAATKYSSAANFLPPFIFPALSLRNSLLCRISCYQQPALHDAFPPSEHATGAGKGSLLASSPQQHSDKHTPKTF